MGHATRPGPAEVVLTVQAPDSTPVRNGLAELEKALERKGFRLVRGRYPGRPRGPSVVVAQAGASAPGDELLAAEGVAVPQAPESMCVKNALESSPPRIILAGRDGRGLMYALLDAARSIELAGPGCWPLQAIEDVAESPFLPERGISVHLFNADLERNWFEGRPEAGPSHCGHWKDRLPAVERDVARVEKLIQQHGGQGQGFRVFPGETVPADTPQVKHVPVTSARAGEDVEICVQVSSGRAPEGVWLHYRTVNQKAEWKRVAACPQGRCRFRAIIPGRKVLSGWYLMYYLEVRLEGGGGALWPSWEEGDPYVVVEVEG